MRPDALVYASLLILFALLACDAPEPPPPVAETDPAVLLDLLRAAIAAGDNAEVRRLIKVFNLLNRLYVDVHILDTLCDLLGLCLLLPFHKAASIFAYFPCFGIAEFILQLTVQRSSVNTDDFVNLALEIVL